MTATAIRNRRGRKRKQGKRIPSGNLAAKKAAVDFRTMAEDWPHRRSLPAAVRSDERGESHLGRLNLVYRAYGARNVPTGHSGISDDQYEAGRRYSVIVGAYLAMASAPRSTAGSGRGYACVGPLDCPTETCVCLARTEKYQRAREAISRAGGSKAHLAVTRVAIHDEPIGEDQLEPLRVGLSALARHFGQTKSR